MVLKNPNERQKGKTMVFFVRHGDRLEFKTGKEINGDDPGLSELGKEQAKEVAKKFARIKDQVDVLYCSNMKRAIETSKEVSKSINKKSKIVPGLSEFNKIVWTKRYYHPKYWKHIAKHRLSIRALNNLLDKHNGEIVVIIAHGNIIKGLIGKKMHLPFRQLGKFDHDNCNITLARFDRRELDYLYYFNSKELIIPK